MCNLIQFVLMDYLVCLICFTWNRVYHHWLNICGVWFWLSDSPLTRLKPSPESKLSFKNVSPTGNCLENGSCNQLCSYCVNMKTQTCRWMWLPLPGIMALIFSSAKRSQGWRSQLPPIRPGSSLVRPAVVGEALRIMPSIHALMDSFILAI